MIMVLLIIFIIWRLVLVAENICILRLKERITVHLKIQVFIWQIVVNRWLTPVQVILQGICLVP